MRRDAEVAPKCLIRSLVIRKKRDRLEKALEAKERRRRRERREKRERRESDHGGLHHQLLDHHGTMPVVRYNTGTTG